MDEAIMVKGLAQGHKRRDQSGWDSNPHPDNTGTWIQYTRPLGHGTPYWIQTTYFICAILLKVSLSQGHIWSCNKVYQENMNSYSLLTFSVRQERKNTDNKCYGTPHLWLLLYNPAVGFKMQNQLNVLWKIHWTMDVSTTKSGTLIKRLLSEPKLWVKSLLRINCRRHAADTLTGDP